MFFNHVAENIFPEENFFDFCLSQCKNLSVKTKKENLQISFVTFYWISVKDCYAKNTYFVRGEKKAI